MLVLYCNLIKIKKKNMIYKNIKIKIFIYKNHHLGKIKIMLNRKAQKKFLNNNNILIYFSN